MNLVSLWLNVDATGNTRLYFDSKQLQWGTCRQWFETHQTGHVWIHQTMWRHQLHRSRGGEFFHCLDSYLCFTEFFADLYYSLFFPQLSYIESALRSHYKLQDSRDLGFGTLQRLAGMIQKQKQVFGGGLSPVYYEVALLAKHANSRWEIIYISRWFVTDQCRFNRSVYVMYTCESHLLVLNSVEGECQSVGQLGEMSKVQALASLLSCPLLEDLGEWSQWELVFKPLHGSLKDFIERNAGMSHDFT